MPLHAIGFWCDDFAKYRHPAELVGSGLTLSDRIRVAKYLRDGVVVETYRSFQCCLLGCREPDNPFGLSLGDSERSDGTWVWPDSLAHYVAHHDIRLPDDFLVHVRKANGIIDINLAEQSVREARREPVPPTSHGGRYDAQYWVEWSDTNRNFALVFRIKDSLRRLRRSVRTRSRYTREVVRMVRQQGGWSTNRCMWNKCNRRALKGMAHCARCAIRMSHGQLRSKDDPAN